MAAVTKPGPMQTEQDVYRIASEQEKFEIYIQPDPLSDKRHNDTPVPVMIGDGRWEIKRGEYIEVPEMVYMALVTSGHVPAKRDQDKPLAPNYRGPGRAEPPQPSNTIDDNHG